MSEVTRPYNLRGHNVHVEIDGKVRRVEVVTHIRDERWMAEGSHLPEKYRRPYGGKRTVISEDAIRLIEFKK